MKNKILLMLVTVVLASCGNNPSSELNPSSEVLPSTSETSSEGKNSGNSESFDGERKEDVVLDFYGLNDLHGSVTESDDGKEPGMMKLGTYFRNAYKKNPDGTVLLSSGDMWQGSADSNITRGKMVTEMMNELNFEAMALGNHEFDWTVDYIYENAELANFPMLGANIIDKRTNERADFVEASHIIERSNVKIGVIGTMGQGLTSSILASHVANYTFKNSQSYIEEESIMLREEGAEVIILLDHIGWGTSLTSSQKYVLNHNLVDVVFGGHNHRNDEYDDINNIPRLQTTGNGKEIMYAQLTVTPQGKISKKDYSVIDSYTNVSGLEEDDAVKAIYDYYYENEIKAIKEEEVGRLSSYINKTQLTNLGIYAMLESARKIDEDVVVAIHNTGGVRVNSIDGGLVTYGEIYKAFPFDNDICIFELTGSQIRKLGNKQIGVSGLVLDSSTKYKVAVISYVYEYHRYNINDAKWVMEGFTRDCIADYFRTHGTVYPMDFDNAQVNVL